MEFLKVFLISFFYPILSIILCGLVVFLFEKLFMFLTGGFGKGFVVATSFIGTPVHEIGHAFMCLPFGHKINKICLWNPKAKNGVLGYVNHSYNKKNLWHSFGNLFIGIGPILSGLGVVVLVMLICFPQTLSDYYLSVCNMDYSVSGLFGMLGECIVLIPSMFSESDMPWWGQMIGIVIMLCVCMHINLSPEDIKSSVRALPVYTALCLVVSLIVFLIGWPICPVYVGILTRWLFIIPALYMIIFACSAVILLFAFIIFLIGKIIGK